MFDSSLYKPRYSNRPLHVDAVPERNSRPAGVRNSTASGVNQSNSTAYNNATNSAPVNYGSDWYWYSHDTCQIANDLLHNATEGKLQRLSNEECIKAYGPGNSKMKHRANLLAVTKAQPLNTNATILMDFRYEMFVSNYTGNNWVCNAAHLNANKYVCDWEKLSKTANANWNLGSVEHSPENPWRLKTGQEYPIDYCLSQETT